MKNNLEVTMKIAASTVFCFYLKVHFVHFNVTGPNFYQYHKMLDKIYKDVFESFDTFGEEIRALDIYAPASLTEFKELSLVDDMTIVGEPRAMIYELLLDNDRVLEILKEANDLAAGHIGLQNFLQERSDIHEKWGWMLRSIVEER